MKSRCLPSGHQTWKSNIYDDVPIVYPYVPIQFLQGFSVAMMTRGYCYQHPAVPHILQHLRMEGRQKSPVPTAPAGFRGTSTSTVPQGVKRRWHMWHIENSIDMVVPLQMCIILVSKHMKHLYTKHMIRYHSWKPASLWVYFISDRPRVSDIPVVFQYPD